MTPILTTLISFAGPNGAEPSGDLITDSHDDLFGTTSEGGANSQGTVFEIVKTAAGYASTPTILVSFNGTNGANPAAGLIADDNGDLFGTTSQGGANNDGTVFEVAKIGGGYASTPTTLVGFNGADGATPLGSLIADANGDLFGTTSSGGAVNNGTVFEIAKIGGGYASTPTTLVGFDFAEGGIPGRSLVADASGDLFGTLVIGGGASFGTVFEIAKSPAGYASAPITLARFPGSGGVGAFPNGGLIVDSHGDLFGTTASGGVNANDGTVFEIVNTRTGYASTPVTLASFNGADGSFPEGNLSAEQASLIADAKGDLFGTTPQGGPGDDGTVFEIKNTATGYASPTTVASFDGANGASPFAGLTADANGNLFGTTPEGGPGDDGTVFEITSSGFVPGAWVTPPGSSHSIVFQNDDWEAAVWTMDGTTPIGGGAVGSSFGPGWYAIGTGDFNDDTLPDILFQNDDGLPGISYMNGSNEIASADVNANPGPNWYAIGMGDFNDDSHSDILFQSTSGQAAVWDMNGNNVVGGGAVSPNPGPSWYAIGTGDFNDDGHSDILWQNDDGQAAIWEMNGNNVIGGGPVTPNPGPSWYAIGTGDFNGDGHSDILWQNANGQVAIWEMNGSRLIGGGVVSANPGPSWFAIGTGGAGHSDILFQNTSGQTAIWDMNGNNVIGGGVVSANPGPSSFAIGLS